MLISLFAILSRVRIFFSQVYADILFNFNDLLICVRDVVNIQKLFVIFIKRLIFSNGFLFHFEYLENFQNFGNFIQGLNLFL